MEDSSQPPLHDHPDHKIDDGYASSSVSTVYSEELSFESDDAESDGEFTGQGASSSLNEVRTTPAPEPNPKTAPFHFTPFTGSDETDDSEDYDSDDEATQESGSQAYVFQEKPTGDTWKKSWPKEGAQTESAGINVYGFYRKRTGCGGYAVLLRNFSAQPIAAIAKVSVENLIFFKPRLLCNSCIPEKLFRQVVPCSCLCQGSKIGKICHKCACSFFPGLSDDFFETLVPLIKELLGKKLCPFNFKHVLRRLNKPAHYLAKQAKEKALVDRKLVDYEASMIPDEFPDELVSFLLNDAYDCNYFY
ncbi:hypothetical protein MKW98_008119 [Papaver atlanticum]|uniref:Uncharacterized protein n=1 Tax=Papaver atlanticum TaxID=357466 RepID=A0AAD4X9P2_9MAGN|nr:hypothetical protein MKW98_008119 [Papaver atlanticum]